MDSREVALAKRPCPLCRNYFLRISAHLANCHSGFSGNVVRDENARRFRCANSSVDIAVLNQTFPNALDVARLLVTLHIPVYKRLGTRKTNVHHYSAEELTKLIKAESSAQASAEPAASGVVPTATGSHAVLAAPCEVPVSVGPTATGYRAPPEFERSTAEVREFTNYIALPSLPVPGGPTATVSRAPPGFENCTLPELVTMARSENAARVSPSMSVENSDNELRESAPFHGIIPLDSGLDEQLLNRPPVSRESDDSDEGLLFSPLRTPPRDKSPTVLCSSPESVISPPTKRRRAVITSNLDESGSDNANASQSPVATTVPAAQESDSTSCTNKVTDATSGASNTIISTSGTDIATLSELSRMQALIKTVDISADGPLPKAKAFHQLVSSMPNLNLPNNPKVIKALSGMANHRRMVKRASEIRHSFRRSLQAPDLRARVDAALHERRWYTKKQLEMCVVACSKQNLEQIKTVRTTESDRKRDIELALNENIRSQNWPGLKVTNTGSKGGLAIATRRTYEKGSVLCDYHGELLDDKAGFLRYDVEYKDNPNNRYMFHFGFEGHHYWIDAVSHCKCHEKSRFIKGRLINHSSKHANVIPKPRRVGDKIHLLLVAKSDIGAGDQLLFDYNCKRDRRSDFEPWMGQ